MLEKLPTGITFQGQVADFLPTGGAVSFDSLDCLYLHLLSRQEYLFMSSDIRTRSRCWAFSPCSCSHQDPVPVACFVWQ